MKYYPCVLLCLVLTTTIVFPSLAAGVQYRVIALGRMRLSTYTIPVGINNFGQVAGWEKGKAGADGRHGFFWHRGRFTDLGTGAAKAINNSGEVVGQHERDVNNEDMALFQSYYWHNGKGRHIGAQYGSYDQDFAAIAINDEGYVLDGGSLSLWHSGKMNSQSTDEEQFYGQALNNHNDIAGYGQGWDVAIWIKGTVHSLIPQASQVNHSVTGLNDADKVIGWVEHYNDNPADPNPHNLQAYVVSTGGTQILPLCAGDEFAVALGINQAGDVVGKSGPHKGYPHAVLWRGGKAIDLNTLIPSNSGWILESAHAINDIGDIVGVGAHNGRQFQAFLLTPVH